MRAGTMAMGLLVAPDGEFRDMRAHDVTGEIKVDMSAAGTAFVPYLERHVGRVGDEIHRHLEPPNLPFAAEIVFFFRRKAVGKNEIVSEYEIKIMKQVHHKGRAGHGKISDGGVPLPVEVLVLCVQRNGK